MPYGSNLIHKDGEMEYLYRRRKSRRPPWGYDIDPHDPWLLKPNREQLELLEKAKHLIKEGCSYRDVAKWLTAKTGRYISYVGLRDRIKRDKSNRMKMKFKKEPIPTDKDL